MEGVYTLSWLLLPSGSDLGKSPLYFVNCRAGGGNADDFAGKCYNLDLGFGRSGVARAARRGRGGQALIGSSQHRNGVPMSMVFGDQIRGTRIRGHQFAKLRNWKIIRTREETEREREIEKETRSGSDGPGEHGPALELPLSLFSSVAFPWFVYL